MSFPFLPRVRQHGCGDPGHEIPFACLFEGTQYLTRTPAAAGNVKKWSFSVEIKRAALGSGLQHGILSASPVSNYGTGIKFAGDAIQFYHLVNGTTTWVVTTTALFRDPAATLNLVVDYDSAAAAAIDRVKIQVNGVLQTLGGTFPSQNFETYINTSVAHHVGADRLGTLPFNGYLSAFHFLDGITADPTDFGYVNRFGVWVPKKYTGTYGTQGFHLDFGNPLALGADVSGNGNHFTASGLTAANQVTDTPTHGYPTLNPLRPGVSSYLYRGNLELRSDASGSDWHSYAVPAIPRGGRVYHEVEAVSSGGFGQALIGIRSIIPDTTVFSRWAGTGADYPTYGTYGLAVDLDTGAAWVRLPSGLYAGGGDPVAGTSPTGTFTPAPGIVPQTGAARTINTSNIAIARYNFGQKPYVHGAPEGYLSWSVADAPCPAIKTPTNYVTTRLSSGGAGVADLPWNPTAIKTLVLSKRRDSATDWRVNDTLRPGRAWATNTAAADFAEADGLSFTATGYTIGAAAAYQGDRVDYVWRASPAAGFDLLLVNHTTGSPTTVPHAVGGIIDHAWVVPLGGGTRRVFHRALGAGLYIPLNGVGAQVPDAGWFSSSAVDLTLGASLPTGLYAVRAWRSVPGFSAFGLYTGNGSVDGTFVALGFTPALFANRYAASTTENWLVRDRARSPGNPVNAMNLFFNLPSGDDPYAHTADFLSNDIKLRGTHTAQNASAAVYAYAAWAEAPGKFARAQ